MESFSISINDPSVLPPLNFSETLVGLGLAGKRVLDVGTGCGIIALCAKKRGAEYVLGIDINESAIAHAEFNAKTNLGPACGVEFQLSNLYDSVPGAFDIITCNPPLLKLVPVRKDEYKFCGGDFVEKILERGKEHLNPNGEIRILYPRSGRLALTTLALEFGYTMEQLDHHPSEDTALLRILFWPSLYPKLNVYVFRPLTSAVDY